MKLAVAGIADGALVAQAIEAATIDRNVEGIIGCRDTALAELLRNVRHLDTNAGLDAAAARKRVSEHICKLGL